jgi:ubiquinone/menaquinone biosynthesis C-methylase UbiE
MKEASGYQISGAGAQMYERYATQYMGQWAPELIDIAALQPGERVLDLACGTGLLARLAAAQVGQSGRVTGLDINAGMLAVAREIGHGCSVSIDWIEGSAVAMTFPDASFEVIVCQQGLQFFPDREAALREMLRVLGPDGRVALSVWKSPSPYSRAVGDALEQVAGAEAANRYRAGRQAAMAPSADTLSSMLVAAGFRAVDVRPRTRIIRHPTIETFVLNHLTGHPIGATLAALGEEGRAQFARLVKAGLSQFAEGDGVAYPDEVNVATARR